MFLVFLTCNENYNWLFYEILDKFSLSHLKMCKFSLFNQILSSLFDISNIYLR